MNQVERRVDRPDDGLLLDERSLQHFGSYALALTRHFGSVSLSEVVIGYGVAWRRPPVERVGAA